MRLSLGRLGVPDGARFIVEPGLVIISRQRRVRRLGHAERVAGTTPGRMRSAGAWFVSITGEADPRVPRPRQRSPPSLPWGAPPDRLARRRMKVGVHKPTRRGVKRVDEHAG